MLSKQSSITDEELAEMERRARAATPGPWRVEPDDGRCDFHGFPTQTSIVTEEWPGGGWSRYGFNPADAEFIAHARSDVPRLIADLWAKDKLIKELEERLNEAQLRSIEARNPGIDMEEVKQLRSKPL